MPPFVIFALPRSRTAWLSQFLTYGDAICGHEQLRHMRSVDDIKAWFAQPDIGTAETSAAPWWRLLDQFAPNAKVLVVRRPVEEVVESLMRLPGVAFDRAMLTSRMQYLDRKLDQIKARVPGVLSVRYADLIDEATCKAVFEHCLPYSHDRLHWARWAAVNVQCNMKAMMRYAAAYAPALERLAAIAKHHTLAAMAMREPVAPEGLTLQTESFDDWVAGAEHLFRDHMAMIGENPAQWEKTNIPYMRRLYEHGAMQITTARCNGRMFGYLMTVIGEKFDAIGIVSSEHTTFYASPLFPGLGLKLQRQAARVLKERGVSEIQMRDGLRGNGGRINAIYRRMGAQDFGHLYRLDLAGVQ